MQTVVHVTHEAIQKIGGIGAVLHGLLTSKVYLTQATRNILVGPGEKILDGSIRKEFTLIKKQKLEFRAEFFNMLDHPYFAQPDNFLDDGPGSFGTITSLSIPMRQVQFGLKYRFSLFTLREMNAVPSDDSRFLGSHG